MLAVFANRRVVSLKKMIESKSQWPLLCSTVSKYSTNIVASKWGLFWLSSNAANRNDGNDSRYSSSPLVLFRFVFERLLLMLLLLLLLLLSNKLLSSCNKLAGLLLSISFFKLLRNSEKIWPTNKLSWHSIIRIRIRIREKN